MLSFSSAPPTCNTSRLYYNFINYKNKFHLRQFTNCIKYANYDIKMLFLLLEFRYQSLKEKKNFPYFINPLTCDNINKTLTYVQNRLHVGLHKFRRTSHKARE